MAAVFKSVCGKEDYLCTFLLLDLDLAREWLNSFRQFLDASKASLASIKAKALFVPCTMTSLAEHEQCFQQWCVLQLLLGVLASVAYLLLAIIWNTTSDSHVKVSMGSIIVDACLRLALAFLATWMIWFGVVTKKGCCCAVACCCLGKPNILAVAIVEGLIALSTALTIIQALGHGHILLILAALVAAMHLVSQVYLTIEAAFVWWKSLETAAPTKEANVGPPVILGREKETEAKSTDGVVESGADSDAQQNEGPVVESVAPKGEEQV
jgi:hypothetical protein